MRTSAIFPVWGRILRGYRPFLSVEITKECPLRCPGCYAYDSRHMNNGHSIRELIEWQGKDLVAKFLALARRSRPVHISIVGGEPLIRHREITELLPYLDAIGIEVQIVSSGVLPIPAAWARFRNLHLVISVDGLEKEHNMRRSPATYDRILRNIAGHRVIIHCTIVPQFLESPDYLKRFADYWSRQESARKIWFSLFTPQSGDAIAERLTPGERSAAIEQISMLRPEYPKVHAPALVLDGMRYPPASPADCIFAQVTKCVSPDLSTPVLPCQIGGRPECRECGCLAAAGFASIGKYRLAGILKLSDIFSLSRKVGLRLQTRRDHSSYDVRIP